MRDSTFDLFNFYVSCGDPAAPKLYKAPLERSLQQELTVHFEALRAQFKARGEDHVAYDPGYRPEPGELFRVPDFRLPARLRALGVSPPTLPAVDDATLESERVRALVGASLGPGDSGPLLVFQAIDGRQVLRREGFAFLLSERVFRKNQRSGLVVRDSIDACFEGGALYFSSEFVARRFLDLSGLFEEATSQELSRFFAHELFAESSASQLQALSDQWIRRKVKMLQREHTVERLRLPELLEHAERFQVKLAVRGNQLLVPRTRKDLKTLLRFLDEDFLESSLSQSRYLANSKRKLATKEAAQGRPARDESQRKLRVGRLDKRSAS
ncbi:MAG: hypothetical protein QM756_06885 [Polyangiaceae bacterium]